MQQKMTLARALRYKKRVLEKIRQLELARKQRTAWVSHLVDLKLALQAKTAPIQRLVFELAEAKSEIAFLQRIDVTHGTIRSRFREEQTIKMEATLRKAERDQAVADLQKKIDELQTRIDAHNAEVTLELNVPELP